MKRRAAVTMIKPIPDSRAFFYILVLAHNRVILLKVPLKRVRHSEANLSKLSEEKR